MNYGVWPFAEVIISSSYLPHAEGIYLFLNIQPYIEYVWMGVVMSPLAWALIAVNSTARSEARDGRSEQRRRFELGAAMLLALVFPSLPRWAGLKQARFSCSSKIRLSSAQRIYLTVFLLAACISIVSMQWMLGISRLLSPIPWRHMIYYWPLWLCGAYYELSLVLNAARTDCVNDVEPSLATNSKVPPDATKD